MNINISIGGGYGASSYLSRAGGGQRPDPAAMQQKLFQKLDSDGDGGVSEAEFGEFSKNAPTLPDGVKAPSFSDMDSDQDGKLSQSEFAEGGKKLEAQFHSQFESLRASGGFSGPPPSGGGEGLSKDAISSLAARASGAGGTASGKLSDLAENFDAADSNQDGKVSIEELLAYEDKKQESSTSGQKSTLQDKLQSLVISLLGDGQDRLGSGVSVSA